MGTGHIGAPDRWAAMQSRTLFPAKTWETQPGNQCRRQYINQGNNTGADSEYSSPRTHPSCACVEGEAGKVGNWKNGDQVGLEPRSRGGRTQILTEGRFRGRSEHTMG